MASNSGSSVRAASTRLAATSAQLAATTREQGATASGFGGSTAQIAAAIREISATGDELLRSVQSVDAGARRTAEAAGHAARARELARDRYQKGLVDFVTVAETQRQSFLADAARIALDRLTLDNRIDLFLALGGGYRRPAPDAGASRP
jgi:methyl-accepting chemotaxis protein WspA